MPDRKYIRIGAFRCKDITDEKFGLLTALKPVSRDKHNNVLWLCRCDCGNETVTRGAGLFWGDTLSCGCTVRCRTHGYASHVHRSVEYRAWVDMRRRCENPDYSKFKNWGGRGIKVCVRWSKFENFLADMGLRPDGHSLERIDNDGDYEPLNCKWAPWSEQLRNRRRYGSVTSNRQR